MKKFSEQFKDYSASANAAWAKAISDDIDDSILKILLDEIKDGIKIPEDSLVIPIGCRVQLHLINPEHLMRVKTRRETIAIPNNVNNPHKDYHYVPLTDNKNWAGYLVHKIYTFPVKIFNGVTL